MDDVPANAAEGLRELREQFARRLPVRLEEIEEAWRAAQGAGWEAEPLRRLHRLTHSLRGTAATFGFPEVAAAALRFETSLQEALTGRIEPGGEAEERLAGLLAELRASCAPP